MVFFALLVVVRCDDDSVVQDIVTGCAVSEFTGRIALELPRRVITLLQPTDDVFENRHEGALDSDGNTELYQAIIL